MLWLFRVHLESFDEGLLRGNDGEYDSVDEEDSNAEDNPQNEYPDEEEEGLLDDEEKEGI